MKYIVEVKYTNPAHEHVSLRRRVDTVSRVVEARSEEEAINRVANQQRALGFMIREAKVIRPNSLKEEIEQLEEKLSANDSASEWISDFVHSENPKFEGKTKKERIRMALGAYYAAKREKNEAVDLKKIAAKKTERNKINMKPTVSDTRIHEETDTIQVDNQHLLNNIEMINQELDVLTSKPYQNAPILLTQLRGCLERLSVLIPASATNHFLNLSAELIYSLGETGHFLYIVYDTNDDGYVDGYAQIVSSDELEDLIDMDEDEILHSDRDMMTNQQVNSYRKRDDDSGNSDEY